MKNEATRQKCWIFRHFVYQISLNFNFFEKTKKKNVISLMNPFFPCPNTRCLSPVKFLKISLKRTQEKFNTNLIYEPTNLKAQGEKIWSNFQKKGKSIETRWALLFYNFFCSFSKNCQIFF